MAGRGPTFSYLWLNDILDSFSYRLYLCTLER